MEDTSKNAVLLNDRAAAAAEVYSRLCLCGAAAAAPFLDALTSVLLLLNTFLFAVICRYARRYLAGDRRQAQFSFWLCATGTCVFVLILAQNLLLFALGWLTTSLSLHQLLQFYRERQGALLAARKKFLISRLGDCALAGALILTYSVFHTWDYQKLFAASESLRQVSSVPNSVSFTACLLVLAAMLKSAQFPFHSWLPDTMETPTPVSALMHAGIINAGGILVIRLAPLISLSPPALGALAVVGGFTAIFGSIVSLTQSSVKRCLAFSTVAQMGFMMLECGLGAFHLALLHLSAHSLYKAYAFLSSGTAVSTAPRRQGTPARLPAVTAGLIAATVAWLAVFESSDQPLLTGIFLLAIAQMLWGMNRSWQVLIGLPAGVAFAALYAGLERTAAAMITPMRLPSLNVFSGLILTAFVAMAVLQSQLYRIARWAPARSFYVHARNGFYFNTLANRLTMAMWPVQGGGRN